MLNKYIGFIYSSLFFIVVNAICVPILAQDYRSPTDSIATVGDTVIIYKNPLVISKKVYVEEVVEKKEKNYFLDTYVALIGFNHSNKPNNSLIAPHPNFTMPLVGFGLGASVYRKIKNWNIGLGLGVLAEREKIKANWKYAVIDTVQQPRLDTLDVYYVQNSAGTLDTITLVELRNYTNYVSQNKEQNIAHNNIYFYLEPVFSIGYNVLHRKFSLCIIGSLIPSILFYANAGTISKISPDKSLQVENHLRSNITLAYGLGLNFCYQLNDQLGIFLMPEYRNDIFSITKSASNTTLTRSGIAGKVGLRIFF